MASALFTGAKHAQLYAKFRPFPPQKCTDYIISYLKRKIDAPFKKAIDIGCGSGQSSKILSPYFENVLGIDVSEAQIECAKTLHSSSNIEYKVSSGEKLPVASSSVQLVTFCQSAHWFNLDEIFHEVHRVLVPKGVVAVYGYWIPLPKIQDEVKNKQVNYLITQFLHEEKLGKYWDKERYIVQDHYKSIHLPFSDSHRANFTLEGESSLANYIGYLSTWSSYQKFLKENNKQAEVLLQDIQAKLIEVLEEDKSPEDIFLNFLTDYFLIIGHKSE